MKKSIFTIDTLPGQLFEGYTNGEDWNGWSCPYFSFEEGQKIVQSQNLSKANAYFDEENDQFVFVIEDEKEYYQAIQEGNQKLYPIGNGSWIWEEKND